MATVREAAQRARKASYRLQAIPSDARDRALGAIADELKRSARTIVAANAKDLKSAEQAGLASPLLKRLKYDSQKVEESIESLRSLIAQEDPIGRVLSRTELDKGLILEKVSCPIGVIGVVFESRPDALVQISALCLKSGNAVLLKGGSEAKNTNETLAKVITEASKSVDERFSDAVQLLSTREEFRELLKQDDLIDLIVPRGSNELVRSIKESTKIPVLGHAAGICHTYVDEDADVDMAIEVCYDAKCQYPAVCNAMETLLVHRRIGKKFLPRMVRKFAEAKVELRGDEETRHIVETKAASDDDWYTEYNDLILSVRIVDSLEEAIEHINRCGSHHTDAIVTNDGARAKRFMEGVDSSSVMWNCSTRFSDGYRYGLGAEVGISTNKTHARGPVGLEGLTIYKWRLSGHGQIVADYVGKGAKKFTHRRLG
ncbi:MAG: glutamate-5-semialdehyde dehydrogenase [Methanomassiliicoccales archaeon]|nr:glutamate-5-semialdehyde dehydrogenase [Methanomassiliicoccales archaeon]